MSMDERLKVLEAKVNKHDIWIREYSRNLSWKPSKIYQNETFMILSRFREYYPELSSNISAHPVENPLVTDLYRYWYEKSKRGTEFVCRSKISPNPIREDNR